MSLFMVICLEVLALAFLFLVAGRAAALACPAVSDAYSKARHEISQQGMQDDTANTAASFADPAVVRYTLMNTSTNLDRLRLSQLAVEQRSGETKAITEQGISPGRDTGGPVPKERRQRVVVTEQAGDAVPSTHAESSSAAGNTAPEGPPTVIVNSGIRLQIDSPVQGAGVYGFDVLVQGAVSSSRGHEVGVTVDGFPAMIYKGRYVANHVPLRLGENKICVRAADTKGNVAEGTVVVSSHTMEPLITLSRGPMVGLAPFETTLTTSTRLDCNQISLSDTGPSKLSYRKGEDSCEWTIKAGKPGVYTVKARENYVGKYFDTIAIVVFERCELDNLLRAKWAHLGNALRNNDIEGALRDIASSRVDQYRRVFSAMTPEKRSEFTSEMQDIQLIEMNGGCVKYDIQTTREGRKLSFLLNFIMDDNGFWKIEFF